MTDEKAVAEAAPGPVEGAEPEPTWWDKFYDKFDADEIFCYDTPKTIRLLDRRLGFINLVGRIIIWIYIFGYVLIASERIFLKTPGYGPLAVKLVNDTYAYAKGPGAEKSKLAFTAFDSVDIVTPFLESGALFVMTEMAKTQGQSQDAKGKWSPDPKSVKVKLQPADVEKFRVRAAAFMSFPSIDPTGQKRYRTDGFGGPPNDEGDEATVWTIETILAGAGLNIGAVKSKGVLLHVTLLFDCFLLLSSCVPKLQVAQLPTAKGFHVWRTHHYATPTGKKRDVEKLTGIRMIWRSVGIGKQIDLVGIIFHIAAGVAMMPIANVFTEFIMLWVLPERNHYISKITEETPDYYAIDEVNERRAEEEARRKEEQSAVDVEALFAGGDDAS